MLPFPSPGDRPDPGLKRASPASQSDSLLLSHRGSTSALASHFTSLRPAFTYLWKATHSLTKRCKLSQDREKNFLISKLLYRYQLSAYWKSDINSISCFTIFVTWQLLILNVFSGPFRKVTYLVAKAVSLQLGACFFLDFKKTVICSWHLSKLLCSALYPI